MNFFEANVNRIIALGVIATLVVAYGLARRLKDNTKKFEARIQELQMEEELNYQLLPPAKQVRYQEKEMVKQGLLSCAWGLVGWLVAGPIGGAITTAAAFRYVKKRWEIADAAIKQADHS